MRYIEFRDAIEKELRRRHGGLTWLQLKTRLRLPYDRPCPSWVKSLEKEICLTRQRNGGRALVWTLSRRGS
jgi:hypothetical protein